MEVIVKEIEYTRGSKIQIFPIGDAHKGAIHCHEEMLNEQVDEIKHSVDTYWLGIGDYGDCITAQDLKRWDARILAPWLLDDRNKKLPVWMRANIDNIGPSTARNVDETFAPIWGKCLGLIEGNHDEGIRKYNHYNFMKELLIKANKKHNVPYAGVQCFVILKFKRKNSSESHEYIIHARHGEGSARTSGARALAVLRMNQSTPDAHITFMGHLHGQESPDIPQRLSVVRGRIKARPAVATMTGAWLRAYMQGVPPSYLERYGCPPSQLGCPKILIEPDKGTITLVKTARIS